MDYFWILSNSFGLQILFTSLSGDLLPWVDFCASFDLWRIYDTEFPTWT